MPGAIQSRELRRGLVFAAAARLAVHQACQQLERAPSAPPVLGPLAQHRSHRDALAGHGHALLARLLPQGVGKRGRRVAIDVIALPSHGTVEEAHHDAGCRSKAQGGTTPFFPYATAEAVVRGRRSTLARCRVRAKHTMDPVARPLLARVVTLGSRLTRLRLERGLCRVRVIQDLSTAAWPFILPAVTRGTQPTPPGGPTGT